MLRPMSFLRTLAALTMIGAVAGCNNGSSSSPSSPSACTLPSGVSASLVYPAPNSTGNGIGVSQVIVAASAALPSSFNVVLIYPNGIAISGNPIQTVQPPFPTPNQVPAFANPIYYTSTFATAQTNVGTVTVALNDLNSSCTPGPILGTYAQ